jgi:hypothetical protein
MEQVLEQDQYLSGLAVKIEQQQAEHLSLRPKNVGSLKNFVAKNSL